MCVKKRRWATLVGGGFTSRSLYDLARRLAPRVFAADGGANHLRRWGEKPESIFGDLDSLEEAAWWSSQTDVNILKSEDQETTDFEKALDGIEAEVLLGLGFLGGRLDHALGALHALAARPDRRILLLGAEEVVFLAPPFWTARLNPGDRVSIWPIRPVTVSDSRGLRWPLDPLRLEAGRRVGVSNEAAAAEVSARFDAPGALILLPPERLEAAIDSLLAAPLFGAGEGGS